MVGYCRFVWCGHNAHEGGWCKISSTCVCVCVCVFVCVCSNPCILQISCGVIAQRYSAIRITAITRHVTPRNLMVAYAHIYFFVVLMNLCFLSALSLLSLRSLAQSLMKRPLNQGDAKGFNLHSSQIYEIEKFDRLQKNSWDSWFCQNRCHWAIE